MTYRAFFLVLMGLPFVPLAGGCGRTACFQWSAAEGACPGAEEALTFFGDPCGGTVQAVEGEGFFDGQLCCYPVTQIDRGRFEAGDCTGGAGGAGGVSPSSSVVSTSVGGGPMQCETCAQALSGKTIFDHGMLCPGSDAIFDGLISCLCSEVCAMACTDSLCVGAIPSDVCIDCASDTAQGCGDLLNTCANDI